MADKRQPSQRSSSSGKQTASQKQPVTRQASSGKPPVSQKQTPSRRPDMIRCENCGEDYSSTYKRCPFCDERPGRTGIGGRRVAGSAGRQVHPIQMVGLVISLILIIAALFIVFTRIAPLITGRSSAGSSVSTSQGSSDTSGSGIGGSDTSSPDASGSQTTPDTSADTSSDTSSGSGSQTQGTTGSSATSITLNKTDITLLPNETTQLTAALAPAGASGTITWSSSDTSLATVDEYGNVKNVNQGSSKEKAVITATCGTLTATCDVHCRPVNESSGSGTSTGQTGTSTGGSTSTPVTPNSSGTIVNAGGGLNVRSGPGSSYEKVASIKNGDKIIILEDAGSGWYKVDIGGGVTGYISSDYVSVG